MPSSHLYTDGRGFPGAICGETFQTAGTCSKLVSVFIAFGREGIEGQANQTFMHGAQVRVQQRDRCEWWRTSTHSCKGRRVVTPDLRRLLFERLFPQLRQKAAPQLVR